MYIIMWHVYTTNCGIYIQWNISYPIERDEALLHSACYNMDELPKYFAKRRKPIAKHYILCDSVYM